MGYSQLDNYVNPGYVTLQCLNPFSRVALSLFSSCQVLGQFKSAGSVSPSVLYGRRPLQTCLQSYEDFFPFEVHRSSCILPSLESQRY
jgi:hypothetical protein